LHAQRPRRVVLQLSLDVRRQWHGVGTEIQQAAVWTSCNVVMEATVKEGSISKPEDLDAALAGNAINKREKLWRAAEGRSLLWVHSVGWGLGALLIFSGVYQGFFEQRNSLVSISLGLFLLMFSAFRYQQSQINALRELLKLDSKEA